MGAVALTSTCVHGLAGLAADLFARAQVNLDSVEMYDSVADEWQPLPSSLWAALQQLAPTVA